MGERQFDYELLMNCENFIYSQVIMFIINDIMKLVTVNETNYRNNQHRCKFSIVHIIMYYAANAMVVPATFFLCT